ncbi:sensor histidine kinase KdpD [Blastococcus sp. URHD0036]|uniref:sensor histidine kinase n=1 Tax=Blastococcus sp. URHD0036 TaxID=1380356 RepID=UPI0004970A34|nr:ATP-binding protein [Blastococcus sp. URHD0036]
MTSTNATATTLRRTIRRLGPGRAVALATAVAAALAVLALVDLEARHEVLVVAATVGFLGAGCGHLLRWRVTGNDTTRSVGAGLVLVGLSRPTGAVTEALVGGADTALSPAVEMVVVSLAAATVLRAFPDAGARRRPVTAGLVVLALGGAVALGLGTAIPAAARPAAAGAALAVAALWGATAVAAWRSDQLSTGHRRSAQALAAITLTLSAVAALTAVPVLLPEAASLTGLAGDLATVAAASGASLAATRRLTDALAGQERYVAGLLEQLAGHERQLQQARACLHDARAAVAGVRAATSAVRRSAGPAQAAVRADLEESIAAELARMDRLLRLPDRAPQVSRTDLDRLLRPLVVSHRERGLRLRWLPGGAAPVAVDADALAVIVGNLLGNALVHAPGAVCSVTVEVGDVLTVTVADDGPGLPATRRAAAFEAGERGTASPGEGLGLAISRDLARRHGGDLVAADASVGCRFVLTLPLAPAPVEPPPLPRPRFPIPDHVAFGPRTPTPPVGAR